MNIKEFCINLYYEMTCDICITRALYYFSNLIDKYDSLFEEIRQNDIETKNIEIVSIANKHDENIEKYDDTDEWVDIEVIVE